jgi:tyrosine-specific transport protein
MRSKAKGSVFGGVLLIGGTCIGAGMLGLPVMTAAAGFYPTVGAFLLVWFFMTCSALAYLEVSMRLPGDNNLNSIAEHTLGHIPKVIAGVLFLLLLYALIAAYASGGTTLFAYILGIDLKSHMHVNMMTLAFVLLFALPVYLGTIWLDRLNRLLMIGFIATFISLCALAFNVGPAEEFHPMGESKYLLCVFQYIVTAFGFHNLIPSLKTYLRGDIKKLRLTIIIGGLLPLVVYAIWELIILHLIPTWGEGGLVEMFNNSLNGKLNPSDAINNAIAPYGEGVVLCQTWFAFFALTTCFMGVGLAISDFFADALRIKKYGKPRLGLCLLAFAPPTIYTMLNPEGFVLALEYAGVLAAILLIIYPVIMAWSARYIKKLPGEYKMGGGKLLLILTLLFGIFVVAADVAQHMGVLPIPHN